ncbi:MAG: hypothetical protein HYS27_19890 [Deltaproteobacteria bacterium]|nr:hypothetical protein [Deltaproteobacteria bacterium]
MTVRLLLPVLALVSALLPGLGCLGFQGGAGDRPEGFRLVQGTLVVPEEDLLGRQVTGLQIAGIAIVSAEDPVDVGVFGSSVFDASRADAAAFVAPVDGARSFVLVLQVPSASGRGPGSFLGLLSFLTGGAEGSLIPPSEDDIDLGPVTVISGDDRPAGNRLKVGDANNPLAQIDTDDDGTMDLADPDDDEDGTPDASDTDTGDDGVDDAAQTLAALPDEDGDGVPDLLAGG